MALGSSLRITRISPSPYNKDWWAADLAETLDQPQKVEEFASIIGASRENLHGLPFNSISRGGEPAIVVSVERDWNRYLRAIELDWLQIKHICMKFGTAPPLHLTHGGRICHYHLR